MTRNDGDTMTSEEHQAHLAATRFKNEAAFQHWLREVATENNWLYHHNYDSRRSDSGFPDTVLVRDGRLIFAELKTEKGKVTEHQENWLGRLREVESTSEGPWGRSAVEVCVWRPSDVDAILEVLQ